MGTNSRYADSIDRRMDKRIGERIMQEGQPQSLSDEELELNEYDVTRTRKPKPVRAWVRYPGGPVRVDAKVVAWTNRAVAIEWLIPTGQKHRAWIWASAIKPVKT